MPFDDVDELFIQIFADEFVIAGFRRISANRLEIPERRIDRIVFGNFARVGKTIRQHSLGNMT